MLLYSNNKLALKLLQSNSYYKRTKHINIAYYYTKEYIKLSKLIIQHIRLPNIAANSLTKLFNYVTYKRFLAYIKLTKPIIITTRTNKVKLYI